MLWCNSIGVTPLPTMIIFVVFLAIAFIVVSSTWFKLHPLAGLLLAALGVGIFAGLPIDKLAETIGKGFGELMSKIGLMVILGCVIGAILDKSGAAIKVADIILKLFGEKYPAFAMSVIGAIVGIPVFCDSGFIILAKLNKIVAKKSTARNHSHCSCGGTLCYAYACATYTWPALGSREFISNGFGWARDFGWLSSFHSELVYFYLVCSEICVKCRNNRRY